jgi:cytochrome P450
MTEHLTLDHTFTRWPLPILTRLQIEAPISRATVWGGVPGWLVTRYDDAKALLADPRMGQDRARALSLMPPDNSGVLASELNANMLHSDPPDHTRLRKLVVKAFSMRAVDTLLPKIENIADELLDAFETDAPVDLIANYAGPLTVNVISELLGVPVAYRSHFQSQLTPIFNQSTREEKEAAGAELTALIVRLLDEKRHEPTADLTSALIEATDNGNRLSEKELLATMFLLIAAGFDTTVNMIANGVLALLRHPAQLAALRADPSLIGGAVDEILRFDSPVNITARFTTAPIPVGDVVIPANEFVLISLLAANRDAAHFDDPEAFDITRKSNAHIAFGYGAHYCVGAALARLEGRTALTRLLQRFGQLELATTERIEYRDSILMHGLPALAVWCQPS